MQLYIIVFQTSSQRTHMHTVKWSQLLALSIHSWKIVVVMLYNFFLLSPFRAGMAKSKTMNKTEFDSLFPCVRRLRRRLQARSMRLRRIRNGIENVLTWILLLTLDALHSMETKKEEEERSFRPPSHTFRPHTKLIFPQPTRSTRCDSGERKKNFFFPLKKRKTFRVEKFSREILIRHLFSSALELKVFFKSLISDVVKRDSLNSRWFRRARCAEP